MELRPGYRLTEAGLIPEEWMVAPLSHMARRISRGASPRPINSPIWFDGKSPIGWVRIADVTKAHRYLDETEQRLSDAGVRSSRFVPSGSLIMSICATVGRPIETRIDTCIHDGFVVFDRPTIDQSLLYHILTSLEPTWSDRGQTGSQMNLNTGLINSRMIALPTSDAEQRAIAAALSNVDALLLGLERLIAKKRDLKQGAMQQLLTGQSRLPGFSEEWEVSTVGREFEIQLGKMLDAEKNFGVPKPYIGNKAVQWGGVDVGDLPTVPMSRSDIDRFRLKKGDLLVCEGGEVGRAAIWEAPIEECYYQKALHRLRPIRGFDPRLMAALLRLWSDRGLLSNYVTQTSIAHLPREKFMEVPLPVPSPTEQSAIADVLSDMDAELSALESRRDKTRALKQGMMQELLTGRTRLVPTEDADA